MEIINNKERKEGLREESAEFKVMRKVKIVQKGSAGNQ